MTHGSLSLKKRLLSSSPSMQFFYFVFVLRPTDVEDREIVIAAVAVVWVASVRATV